MNASQICRMFGLDSAGLDSAGLDSAATLSDGPVAQGRQGNVWRLKTSGGSWAVKVPFHPSNEDEARPAALFQEAACAAGVPAPGIVRTTNGDVFATVDGTQVRVYEWVDVLPPDTMLDPSLVGQTLACLHQLRVDLPLGPVDPWYTEPVGADGWDSLVRKLFQAGAPFAARLAALRDELVALESWLEPPSPLMMCHRDLWADNLLPTARGGVCVIDWENSGPADPAQELACALFEFGRTDPDRARALIAAYREAGGPAEVSRPGHFTMLLAQLGHIAHLAASDWLDPLARNRDRAESEAWIAEILDDPHSRAALQGLLRTLQTAPATGDS